uniref:Uncharacterized protein n=1 Tax=Tanacetum cinerariifolium TaxID=118510 RepID=A0A699K576_TANCI|nr:hypothetical protein [Tanacetum cinerariifolium]
MVVAQEVGEGVADEVHDEGVPAASVTAEGDVNAANDEVSTTDEEPSIPSPTLPTLPPQPSHDIPSTSQIAQALEITRLKRRVKKLARRNKVKVLKLRRFQKVRILQRIDTSDDTVMDDVSNQGRMIVDMDADADVVLEEAKEVAIDNAKDDQDTNVQVNADIQGRIAESKAEIYKIDLDHANKLIMKVVSAATTTISAADVPVVPAAITAAAPKLTSAPSRRTKGIDEEESRALKKINETPAEKAAKRKKLEEEVKELKRHLQIVPNRDDDVYTEAIPLARKKNQRSIHGPAKVKGWKLLESCDVQIITFTTTQLILLVERKYPLIRFTLDQMLNAVRLEVKEESEVSLELLRFIRQQHQKGAQLE